MAKTETEKLAGTMNGCLQLIAVLLVIFVGGCLIGPCTIPLLMVSGDATKQDVKQDVKQDAKTSSKTSDK